AYAFESFVSAHIRVHPRLISSSDLDVSALICGQFLSSAVALMASTTSLVFAGIAPHPPIMVPEVGRDAIAEVQTSIDAMADMTRRIIESEAETVVLISP